VRTATAEWPLTVCKLIQRVQIIAGRMVNVMVAQHVALVFVFIQLNNAGII